VIVNNTTIIIKQTVAIQQGPSAAVIEKASGRKIAAVPVQELRHKTEAAVVISKKSSPAPATEKRVQPPVHSEVQQPVGKKAVAPREPAQVEKSTPEAPARDKQQRPPAAATENKVQPPVHSEVPPVEKKSVAPHDPAASAPQERKAPNETHKSAPAQPADKDIHPPARENPAASEKGNANPDDKGNGQGKKDKE